MASLRTLLRSFSAGEITPELFGRIDLAKRQEGLALCRNFITLPHGPAVNRPGTEFVSEVKNSAVATRLIPFSYTNTQTFAIEVGAGYFRWHTGAATLLYPDGATWGSGTAYAIGDIAKSGGVNYYCVQAHTNHAPPNASYWYAMPTAPNIYEIPNPYAAADLMDIHYTQSADVLTLVHPSYPPIELRRYGATNWRVAYPSFTPPTNPLSVNVTPTGTGSTTYRYVVTQLSPTLEESVASGEVSCTNDLTTSPNNNTVSWSDSGANGNSARYYVYKYSNGLFGYIGQASGTSFVDNNITPDVSRTPPIPDDTSNFVANGISSIPVTAPGSGYPLAPLDIPKAMPLTITDVTGTGASAVAFAQAGKIIGTAVLSAGKNYTAPTFTITTPGGGSGATFGTAVLTGANYPAAVGYFQQRRCFAGSTTLPQNFWATRSGTESNMSYSIPVQSDNRIAVRIAAREASAVRHIVPTASLLLLTATCEWVCSADANGGVLTPASISLVPRSYVGSSNVTPVVVNNIVLYCAARGGHLRELSYSWQAGGYTSADVSLLAPHLFDYYTVQDMAYSRGPVPILWAVSSTGKLLGMTYVPEQQVSAWHQHDTGNGDVFEACCVITEGNEDMLYVIVKRTVGGATKRYVERLHTRLFSTLADAFFVDCGATYSGAPANSVSGLTWLEGRTVSILADGAVCPQQVVTGGVVNLPQGITASKITVGLPITAQLETLPVAAQTDGGMAQGRQKNVNRAWLRVYRSSGVSVGPDFTNLTPAKLRTTEPYGSPPSLVSDEFEIVTTPAWAASGQMCVQQSDPLPLDLVSMTLEVALGA